MRFEFKNCVTNMNFYSVQNQRLSPDFLCFGGECVSSTSLFTLIDKQFTILSIIRKGTLLPTSPINKSVSSVYLYKEKDSLIIFE